MTENKAPARLDNDDIQSVEDDEKVDPGRDLLNAEDLIAATKSYWWQRSRKVLADDTIATVASVYDNPEYVEQYKPRADYEGIARFDPSFRWTWGEERTIIRKLDWRITLWAFVMFFCLELDRANIKQANSDEFLEDLGLTTDDYNLGNTLFRIGFLTAELPMQLISKKVGPDRWIPIELCLWSIVSICQFRLSGRSSFLVCRFILAFLQGGFIPDIVLYLSYFYKAHELPVRLALFWVSNQLCDIFAAFLAIGILRLRGTHGYGGWQYLFLIEGFLTLVVGIASWFILPPSPTQTQAWYRPKGWFTEKQEKIIVNRILRDDPSKGDMHNRQAVNWRQFWLSLKDYDLWPMYIIGLTFQLPTNPPGAYLTLILKTLGYNTTETNALSVPYMVLSTFTMIGLTYLSEVYDERGFFGVLQPIWTFPLIIAIYTLPQDTNKWVLWALLTLFLGFPSSQALNVGWCSRNSNSVRMRTVSAALYNMFVQLSGVVSNYIYRADDKPQYTRGNRVIIGLTCMEIVIYLAVRYYYKWRNSTREKVWSTMTDEQKVDYVLHTTDQGNKRLDFRFSL